MSDHRAAAALPASEAAAPAAAGVAATVTQAAATAKGAEAAEAAEAAAQQQATAFGVHVGAHFASWQQVKDAMGRLAHSERRLLRATHGNPRWTKAYKCKVDGCKWWLRAREISDGDNLDEEEHPERLSFGWIITKLVALHTCTQGQASARKRRRSRITTLSDDTMATVLHTLLQANHAPPIKELRAAISTAFDGLELSASKLYSLRDKARTHIYGSLYEDFAVLRAWVSRLDAADGNTHVCVLSQAGREHGMKVERYAGCIMVFGSSARMYQHSKRVTAIASTVCTSDVGGTLLTAVTTTAKATLLPLGVMHCMEASVASVGAFVKALAKHVVGMADPQLPGAVISDEGTATAQAMATHLPSVTHILCRNHIARSIKALDSINGVAIPVTERNKAATLFSHTANAYQMRNFTANMASLQRLSPRLHAYVLTRAPEKWARSHIEAQLFMQLTTNWAESYADALSMARKMRPPRMLREITLMYGNAINGSIVELGLDLNKPLRQPQPQQQQVSQLEASTSTTCTLEGVNIHLLNARRVRAQGICVQDVDSAAQRGRVKSQTTPSLIYPVHLGDKACGCRQWQLDGMPCKHAIAFMRDNRVNIDVREGVHKAYTREQDKVMFHAGGAFNQVHTAGLAVDNLQPPVLPPPAIVRRPHERQRPRRRRAQVGAAISRLQVCGRCHQSGHNIATCQVPHVPPVKFLGAASVATVAVAAAAVTGGEAGCDSHAGRAAGGAGGGAGAVAAACDTH